MGGLFAKKKPPPSRITEQDKAVLSLKQQRDKLKQYQKKINLSLQRERDVAKELLSQGKKQKALSLLKKKRYQEQLLTKTDDQLEGIDKMIQDVEFAQVQIKVVEGLKKGNDCLKQLHQMMSLEDVEKIMEETQEGIEYQREIDDIISGQLTQEDEDDIMAELNALSGDEELTLPSIPDQDLPQVEENDKEPADKRQKEGTKAQRIALEA